MRMDKHRINQVSLLYSSLILAVLEVVTLEVTDISSSQFSISVITLYLPSTFLIGQTLNN